MLWKKVAKSKYQSDWTPDYFVLTKQTSFIYYCEIFQFADGRPGNFSASITIHTYVADWALLVAQMVKDLPAMQETQVLSLGQEDPLENGNPLQHLPGECHGQRSQAGYST